MLIDELFRFLFKQLELDISPMGDINRRDLIKQGTAFGAGLTLLNLGHDAFAVNKDPSDPIRIGFVGIGRRGSNLLKILLKIEGVRVCSLCDIRTDRVERAGRWVAKAGQTKPSEYSQGELDFKRMCETEELDLVITATPWRWHVPICVSAMEAGKHAATEVPAAVTLEECWQLVETSEKSQKHCVMLENYCYFRKVMTTLNMIRRGVFGDMLHFEGRTQENWIHENWHLFNSNGTNGWLAEHMIGRNGNLYPTHGFGPLAIWANINRGDRLDHLVSMSSKGLSLTNYAKSSFGDEHKLSKQKYAQGDANNTLLKSENEVSFSLYFGGLSPQPWSPEYKAQGTEGACIGDMNDYKQDSDKYIQALAYEKGKSWHWNSYWDYAEEYEHPLWKELGEEATRLGKGNWSGKYDYLMLTHLIRSIRNGTPPPMDVYDAATWSSIAELSEKSVNNKSSVVDVPDFTQGKWKTREPFNFSA